MKKYDRLLSRLFACCEIQDNYPHSPVLIDTEKNKRCIGNCIFRSRIIKN